MLRRDEKRDTEKVPTMATLYLLRHFKSSWDEPDLPDLQRPLAPRGHTAGKLMARHLAHIGIRPELVLCSAALRTRQTLELIGSRWGDVDTNLERGLYEASEKSLLDRLRALPADLASVLLIGHNPGLERLTALLCAGHGDDTALERLRAKFPTGTLATLDRETPSWNHLGKETCSLRALVRPADLE
jgi:phosphohistidine phosphatase